MFSKNFGRVKSFLFENAGIKQTVVKNTVWLTGATFVNKLLRFALFIYVARILGATQYGEFTFAMSFVGLFIMVSDFGLPQIITRDFSQEREKEREFPAVLSLKILLTAGAFLLMFLGSLFITSNVAIRELIVILAFSSLADNFVEIIYAFFRGRQKMEYQAFVTVLETIITFVAGIFVLFYFPTVRNLSYAYVLASFTGFIVIMLVFNFKFQRLAIKIDKSVWKKFLLVAWPLALIGVLNSIYNQTDSVMLGYFKQITQNGWYNAAYRIIAVTLVPIGLIATSIFPALSKSFKETKERMQRIWDSYMKTAIFFAVPLVMGGMFLSGRIISVVYGESYMPAVLALQILLVTSGIIFLYTPFQQALIIFNQQKKIFWVALGAAMLNIVLNSILIPKYSLYGAAAATVATHFFIGILFLKLTLNFNFISPADKKTIMSFVIAVISSLIMCSVILIPFIYEFNILLVSLTAVLIYLAVYAFLNKTINIFGFLNEKI